MKRIRPQQLLPRANASTHPSSMTGLRRLHLLQHQHLQPTTSGPAPPFVRYDDAAALQEEHRARLLACKASRADPSDAPSAPRPRLLSFQSTPTYTLGRRQDALTPAQEERLTRPLTISPSTQTPTSQGENSLSYVPDVRKTNRGGLTTYHGPGQLVLWPVLDMHSPLYPRFGVASYARHLEATTRRLLAELFAVETYTNPDEPGVWVAGNAQQQNHLQEQTQPERKIAALGVHHRRYVTALGVALNIHLPVTGTDEGVNPWARFVPCGLQGKLVTSVAAEMGDEAAGKKWDMGWLAAEWARRFEEGLVDVGKREFEG